MKIPLEKCDEAILQVRNDIIANEHIGQRTETSMLEAIEMVDKALHRTMLTKGPALEEKREEPAMMLVPIFKAASDEINIMSRLEFVMSHAKSCNELNEEEQARIANWFASKYGEKYIWGE